jgi:DnaJ-class molecular chaperone
MSLLEEEIKVYNGLNPISRPRWLSSPENRAIKKFGSAIIYFESKAEADRALRNRLQIAGISVKTAEFIQAKPTHQYSKCLRYGHSKIHCYRDQICSICAGNHARQDHFCPKCSTKGEKCAHSKLKCPNCQGEHEANNRSCKTFKDLLNRAKSTKKFERFSHIEVPPLSRKL